MTTTSELSFTIEGMTCDDCARTLRGALAQVPGVQDAKVNFIDRVATVTGAGVSTSSVVTAAAGAGKGFVATLRPTAGPAAQRKLMKSDGSFDLIIVGSGGAAFGAALRASELGARVAMVERGTLGGTCVNTGCVPSKTLIRAAEEVHRASHPRFAGVVASARVGDFRALMAQKQALVEELRGAKYANVLASTPNVSLINGSARVRAAPRVSCPASLGCKAAEVQPVSW